MAGLIHEIKTLKKPCEANIVTCFYKNPELLYEYETLKIDDFAFNEWKVYFAIAKHIVLKEKKPKLDDITIGFFLEQHPKLAKRYDEYGGYDTINAVMKYVSTENLEGYVEELHKWNAVLRLADRGFPIKTKFKDFKDMNLEDIYQFYEAQLNDTFINANTSIKSYNMCDGIHDLIDRCHKGMDIGFPLHSPILNDVVGGNIVGNISLLGGCSGTGKTNMTLQMILTNILRQNEQCVIVINEQDQEKLRKEMVTWVINNVFGGNFNKKRFRQGHFSENEFIALRKAADWMEEKEDLKNITIIPLETYNVGLMKKIINKYSALGVKYFILDTFKAGDDKNNNMATWEAMMHDMRTLYDTVKPAVKNVHLWATLQLTKDRVRYLKADNIGMSKNVVDVCSTVMLMRHLADDEKEGGKRKLSVYKLTGTNGKTKKPVILDEDKQYIIIFIDKNREGESGSFQVVAEVDLGRNMYREVGITHVPQEL